MPWTLKVAKCDLELLVLMPPIPSWMLRFQVCTTSLGLCSSGNQAWVLMNVHQEPSKLCSLSRTKTKTNLLSDNHKFIKEIKKKIKASQNQMILICSWLVSFLGLFCSPIPMKFISSWSLKIKTCKSLSHVRRISLNTIYKSGLIKIDIEILYWHLYDIDNFLDLNNLPRLNWKDINSLWISIMSNEIGAVIKNFWTGKILEPDRFTAQNLLNH